MYDFEFETSEFGLTIKSGAIAVFLNSRLCSQLYSRLRDDDCPDFLRKETEVKFNDISLNFSQSEYVEFRDLLARVL